MVSATTAILVPQYAVYARYTFFPTLDANVLASISGLAGFLIYFLLNKLRARNALKVDELVGLTSLSPSVRNNPLLVLRAVDDEASLTLAAAAIGNRLSRLLGRLSYKIWVLLRFLFVSMIVTIVVIVGINYFAPLQNFTALELMTRFIRPVLQFWFDLAFDWVPALGTWLILAFFAFLFSPGVFNCFYGRELLPIFQGCEINSQSAPDSVDRRSEFQSESESTPTNWKAVVTLDQAEEARRGLRHGLYADPQCAERIAGWLQSELASTRA